MNKPTQYFVEYGENWDKAKDFSSLVLARAFGRAKPESVIIRERRHIRDVTPQRDRQFGALLWDFEEEFLGDAGGGASAMNEKGSPTPGPWVEGKHGAIISTDPEAVAEAQRIHSADTIEFYGGAVICESVSSRDMPVIIAAPEKWKALARIGAEKCYCGNYGPYSHDDDEYECSHEIALGALGLTRQELLAREPAL